MLRSMLIAFLLVAALAPVSMAQAACIPLSDWAVDAAGDATVSIDGQAVAGSLDILTVRIGEGGAACEDLLVAVVADQDALEELGAGAAEEAGLLGAGTMAARVIVDLEEDDGAGVDHRLEFVYLVDAELLGVLLGGEGQIQQTWVEHYMDGELVASTESGPQGGLSHVQDGGTIQATIPKDSLGVNGWLGMSATTEEDSELTGILASLAISGPGDSAMDGTAYTLGHGLSSQTADVDGDGLLDPWERDHFDNLSSQDGAGDPDGDGYSNAAEMAAGTDPNSASSKPASAAPPASPQPAAPPASSGDDPGDPTAEDMAEEPKDTPGPGIGLVLLGLLGTAMLRRSGRA